jgi:membrane associated rhomboid family serine protease
VTVPRLLFYLLYSIYIGFRATNIDNFAHIGGLLSGTILAFVLWLTIRNKEGKRENED